VKRIAIAGILTECNDFTSALITEDDFERVELLRGEQMLERSDGVVGGALSGLAKHPDFVPVPLLFTSTSPGGALTDQCFTKFHDEIIQLTKQAGHLDGVLLLLHGAAVSVSVDDIEGELLQSVRKVVGDDIPIMVTLDLHAHITEKMVALSTALFGWETYPHMDSFTTGARAAELIVRTIKKEVFPVQVMARVPVLTSAINASTERPGPFYDLMKKAKNWEHAGKCLSSSVFLVHPYIDRPEMGSGALIVTDGDPESAAAMAREIAQEYWDRRQEFEPEVWKAGTAIHGAVKKGPKRSVLTEVADTCGGGSAGDCVAVLHALLEIDSNIKAIYPVVSPHAAAVAAAAGIGSEVELFIGAEIDKKWGPPVKIKGHVLKVSDGEFIYQGGVWDGASGRMGATAVVRVGAIDIVIATFPTYEWRDEQYRSLGLDPAEYQLIVVKNPMNYFMTYSPIADYFYVIDSPGPTPATCKSLVYTKMQRPFFPFDDLISGDPVKIFGT
jgi:microcystin degradation protein MlrC